MTGRKQSECRFRSAAQVVSCASAEMRRDLSVMAAALCALDIMIRIIMV